MKIITKLMLSLPIVAMCITSSFAQSGKGVLNAGTGFIKPMGDLNDIIDYGIPLTFGGQFSVLPNISLEADFSYWIYTEIASKADALVDDYKYYQFSIGARLWPFEVYKGVYLGVGIGFAKQEIETKGFGTQDDDAGVLIIKAGYAVPMGKADLDIGLRYDGYDFEDWGDRPLTLTVGAQIKL